MLYLFAVQQVFINEVQLFMFVCNLPNLYKIRLVNSLLYDLLYKTCKSAPLRYAIQACIAYRSYRKNLQVHVFNKIRLLTILTIT